jgi:[ribosomal protein S5]-alanine N-acetyltransferase
MDAILRTQRLTLRPLSPDDAEPTARAMSDAVARWTGSWTGHETPQSVAARIARHAEANAAGNSLDRAAVITATGELIGWMGVRRSDKAPRRGMLGYWIGEPWFGQGYTREAVRALVPYAFEALDLDLIDAFAQTANTASLAILRGLGMRHMGQQEHFATARGVSDLCDFFELDRP